MTLTSKIGQFHFHPETPLSIAKLIRDTVMGQVLAPAPNSRRLRSTEDVDEFVKEFFRSKSLYFRGLTQ